MPHLYASQFLDNSGDPLASGKIYTYQGGTTTPLSSYPTYDDAVAGTNANANPLVLDSAGRGQVWLTDVANKVKIDTSAGVTLQTIDDIYGGGGGTVTTIASDNTIDITILKDNNSSALTFKEASNDYLNFDTTNSAEKIDVVKALSYKAEIRAQSTGRVNLGAGGSLASPTSDSVAGKSRVILLPGTAATTDHYAFTGMTDGQILYVFNEESTLGANIIINGGSGVVTIPAYEMVIMVYDSTLGDWMACGQ